MAETNQPTESTTSTNPVQIEFEVLSQGETVLCKVLGTRNRMTHEYEAPPASCGLIKDEQVTLISGKYPLNDYKDTKEYSAHVYTFLKSDGTQRSGILDGFTFDCTYEGIQRGVCKPTFCVELI
jgi:hypothetical protein